MSVRTDISDEETSSKNKVSKTQQKPDTSSATSGSESISIDTTKTRLEMGHYINELIFDALLRLERERRDVSDGTACRHGEENERPISAHMIHLVVEGFVDGRRRGPNIYTLLENLVDLDLVEKQRCPNSRSDNCYQVTEKGWGFAEEIGATHHEPKLGEAGRCDRRQKMGLQEFCE